MEERLIYNLVDLEQFAKALLAKLNSKQLLLISGPLGVGKTQLVQFLLNELNVPKNQISSPTFSLHHTYDSKQLHKDTTIHHLDLYRLLNEEEFESTGLWDLFLEPTSTPVKGESPRESLIIIEWAEKLPTHFWPKNWNQIKIIMSFFNDSGTEIRKLQIE
ncbi:MAG: tRNA (adenosine(37)-N6)-threonylcarbamoyltransferase complex ATPase subunit type 1 TsaE [Bdellovibrionales bacterium]|nr:tRNA (adenosine(37)-N6)-threonylcarbamoyltransferase complex ATPase subunit type 1 TsaE [Bdellovibrionales bacterium]